LISGHLYHSQVLTLSAVRDNLQNLITWSAEQRDTGGWIVQASHECPFIHDPQDQFHIQEFIDRKKGMICF
jgi:hypothetical protein